jgi:hypothetical protein
MSSLTMRSVPNGMPMIDCMTSNASSSQWTAKPKVVPLMYPSVAPERVLTTFSSPSGLGAFNSTARPSRRTLQVAGKGDR